MRLLALLLLVCSSAHAATAYQSFGELIWRGEGFLWTGAESSQVNKGEAWGDYIATDLEVTTSGPAEYGLKLTRYMGGILAPGASVTFSVLASVRASDNAHAEARIGIGERFDSLGCLTSLGESCDQSRTLTLTATNDTQEAMDLNFSLFERRFVKQDALEVPGGVTPVPEPETWALMLLGLTGLAAARRRNARSG